MGYHLVKWALDETPDDLSSAAKFVATVIAHIQHDQEREPVTVTVPTLMRKTNLSRRGVQRALQELERRGILDRPVVGVGRTKPLLALRCHTDALDDPNASHGHLIRRHSDALKASHGRLSGTDTIKEEHREHGRTPPISPTSKNDAFDVFWLAYPKKVGKQEAVKVWGKLSPADRADALAGLDKWIRSDQWREPQFVTRCSVYLRERAWEDEPPQYRAPTTNGKVHEPDPDMTAWLKVVADDAYYREHGSYPGKVPKAINRAVEAVGGWDNIDPANNYLRRDFLVAHKAERLRSPS